MTYSLQKKLDYYEFLIDFVSHEIRNPLSAVIMFTRLLREDSYGEVDARQKEILDRILANAARIEHMTADFLNLSLLEGKRQYIKKEKLDINTEIIQPVLTALEKKHLFKHGQKEAFQSQNTKSTTIWADRNMMKLIFDNLFFNAVKYGRENGKIIYGWKDENNHILAKVKNEGQGVRKKDIKKIFDKFVRLKDRNIPTKKGTGLGLYNVRKIVEMHGGSIWAESEYGSTFTVLFTLPKESTSSPEKGEEQS